MKPIQPIVLFVSLVSLAAYAQETDPVFSASPANGISATDITNWGHVYAMLSSDTTLTGRYIVDNSGLIGANSAASYSTAPFSVGNAGTFAALDSNTLSSNSSTFTIQNSNASGDIRFLTGGLDTPAVVIGADGRVGLGGVANGDYLLDVQSNKGIRTPKVALGYPGTAVLAEGGLYALQERLAFYTQLADGTQQKRFHIGGNVSNPKTRFLRIGNFEIADTATSPPYFVVTDDEEVGIGTDNPQAKLHVAGDMIVEGNITSAPGDGPVSVAQGDFASGGGLATDDNGDSGIFSPEDNRVTIKAGGSGTIDIDNKNVAIGTTLPSLTQWPYSSGGWTMLKNLEITDYMLIDSDNAGSLIQFRKQSNNVVSAFGFSKYNTGANNIFIQPQHNNLTGEYAALAISKGPHGGSGTSANYINLRAITGTSPHFAQDEATITDNGTASNTQFVLHKDGNVGIGTASPDRKLHVAGDLQIDETLVLSSTSATGSEIAGTIRWDDDATAPGDGDFLGFDGTNWVSLTTPPTDNDSISSPGGGSVTVDSGVITVAGNTSINGTATISDDTSIEGDLAVGNQIQPQNLSVSGDVEIAGKLTFTRRGDVFMGAFGDSSKGDDYPTQ